MQVYSGTSITTIDQQFAELFNNNFGLDWKWNFGNLILCFISLILTIVLCGFVGYEREQRGRSAGLRTHLLVGVGSALVMIISIYGFPALFTVNSDGTSARDVARLAAQVVTGVGFLGAGAIIHNNGGIKGLTTASTVWLAMAIGLACGSMNFFLAIGGTILVMIVLTSFRKIEKKIGITRPMFIMLCPSDLPVMSILLQVVKEHNYRASDVVSQIVKDGDKSMIEISFKVSSELKEKIDTEALIAELTEKAHATSVQILNHH